MRFRKANYFLQKKMKITLENFRCWENKEIDVEDDALVLLSGSSGCGKSTILNAINFAITGEGKNIVAYGKSSCRVSIQLGDTTITRSRKPNRLLVKKGEKEFEDDTAQEMVNRLFGSLYSQCSYIQQDNHNTFIYMSPTDKLEFLESFAFHDIDICSKKEQIKECVRERQEAHKAAASSLSSVKEIFEGMQEPELVKFPIKCNIDEQQANIDKHSKLEADLSKKKASLTTDILKGKSELEKHDSLKSRQSSLKSKLDDYESQEETINNKLLKFRKLDEDFEEYERLVNAHRSAQENKDLSRKVKEMAQELQEMEKNELSEKNDRIQQIKKTIWPEEDEETVISYLESFREFLQDMERLESTKSSSPSRKKIDDLTTQIKNTESEIESLSQLYNSAVMSTKVYKCPGCSIHLRFEKNTIIKHGGQVVNEDPNNIQKDLNTKKSQLQTLQKSLHDLEAKWEKDTKEYEEHLHIKSNYEEIRPSAEVREDIDSYQAYYDTNKALQTELERLEKLPESKSLREFRKKYNSLKQSLDNDSEEEEFTESQEEVNEKFQQLLIQKEERKHLSQRLKDIGKVIRHTMDEMEEVNKDLECITLVDLDSLEQEKERVSEKLKKVQDINSKIAKYLATNKLRKNWEDLKAKYEKAQEKENRAGKKLESILLLRDKVVKAESMYLQNIITRLGTNTNAILEHFFPDNPMTIEFKAFKQVKKDTKAQINLQIWYKNNETDLMELSGGERDRLDLAVTIALSQTFGSPLLMLDECISSLDSENFNNVLEYLRDNNAFSHVLLVSHQANEGIFDRVVKF